MNIGSGLTPGEVAVMWVRRVRRIIPSMVLMAVLAAYAGSPAPGTATVAPGGSSPPPITAVTTTPPAPSPGHDHTADLAGSSQQ